MNLLFEEFKDYSRYFAILNAIAEGATKFGEISGKSRVPQNKLSKYLMTLERIGIIKRIIPITEKKSKRAIYKISDNFYRFWFKYMYPNKSFLEMGEVDYVLDTVNDSFNAFVGEAFEDIAAEFLSSKLRCPVGKWWYKDIEIDLVGLGKDAYFFEVKWKDLNYREAVKVLRKLEKKAEEVGIGGEKKYGIIARRVEEKEKFEEPSYLIYDLDDIIRSGT
jgi:AAA+ ATPase superfamily predicted ATPase